MRRRVDIIGVAASLAALVALGGCSNDDTQGVLSQNAMLFVTDVLQSRGGATSDNISDFALFVDSPSGASEYDYSNVKVSRSSSDAAWDTEVAILWDHNYEDQNSGYYSSATKIRAYSPYGASEIFSIESDQSSEEGMVASDLLWADGEVVPTSSTTDSSDDIYFDTASKYVEVGFNHILSKFNITIVINDESSELEDLDLTTNPITQIEIIGNFDDTIEFDYTEGTLGTASKSSTITAIKPYLESYAEGDTDSGVHYGKAIYEAIMIPQTVAAEGIDIVIKLESGAIFTWRSAALTTFESNSVTELTLTAGFEASGNYYFNYIEFDNSTSESANITLVDSDGMISSLISKFRRCLAKVNLQGVMAIAYLDGDDSNLYSDGVTAADLTGGEGDVMVYFPEFWYRYESVDDDTFRYHILDVEPSESYDWVHIEASLVGAYKAVIVDGRLYSRSGAYPIPNPLVSYNDYTTYVKARGVGYQMIDYEQHSTIAMMLYAKYQDRNTQNHIGYGKAYRDTDDCYTGSSNSLGNNDTDSSIHDLGCYVNGLALEGVFGGVMEWVSGVTVERYQWSIYDTSGNVERTLIGYESTDGGFINNLALEGDCGSSSYCHFDMIPTGVGTASGTTYYCDNYHPSATSDFGEVCYVLRSYETEESFVKDYSNCGVSYLNTEHSADVEERHTTRLAYRGSILEMTDAEAFKNLIER